MANLTISMSKIRKILRMNSQGRSTRFIAAQIDSSRNTVRKYLAALKKSGFTFEEVNNLNDKELEDLFGKTRENNQPSSRMQSMLRCFPHVDKELKKTGMNRQLGYSSPADLVNLYPQFYWNSVAPHVQTAIRYLNVTSSGRQWIANLYSNVFRAERDISLSGPQK